jgi:hypothetical protein
MNPPSAVGRTLNVIVASASPRARQNVRCVHDSPSHCCRPAPFYPNHTPPVKSPVMDVTSDAFVPFSGVHLSNAVDTVPTATRPSSPPTQMR